MKIVWTGEVADRSVGCKEIGDKREALFSVIDTQKWGTSLYIEYKRRT